MKKGNFDKEVTMEFLTVLASLLADGTEKGANALKFTLPKIPEIENLPDIEVKISWRFKE